MRWLHARGGRSCCVISIYLDERVFRKAPERFRTETGIPILAAMRKPAVARARQMLIILFQLPTFWGDADALRGRNRA
jgi:GntR family transcriptional regulator